MQFNLWQLSPGRLAAIGFALSLPALFLVTTGAIITLFGVNPFDPVFQSVKPAFHPAVVLGGIGGAFALNALPVLRLHIEPGSVLIRIRFAGRWGNLAIAAGTLLLLGCILVYGIVENFIILPR